jgi:cytochrome b6-f complex iron-sulfur subunit
VTGAESSAQSRRRFLQTAAGAAAAFVVAGCESHKKATRSSLPHGDENAAFGNKIDAGPVEHIFDSIDAQRAPYYVAAARAYVNRYPAARLADAQVHYPDALHSSLEAGVVVLYQRCTHLGCRVPWCAASQYFECPCHDAKFDRVGEYRHGPAPRGLDLMAASVDNGRLIIDSGSIVEGMPVGTNTTHQDPSGPFCV